MAPYQMLKIELVEALGLSRDAFHIFLGFAIFLIFAAAARREKAWSWGLLLPPLIFAILLEVLDLRDALAYGLSPDLADSIKDIFIAIVLPFLTLLYARYRR